MNAEREREREEKDVGRSVGRSVEHRASDAIKICLSFSLAQVFFWRTRFRIRGNLASSEDAQCIPLIDI